MNTIPDQKQTFKEEFKVLNRHAEKLRKQHPFYGSRKMVVYLFRCGRRVNRK
jgi:hypothetical protein